MAVVPKKMLTLAILETLREQTDAQHRMRQADIAAWLEKDYGLKVTSTKPFAASALPYSLEELSEGDSKAQRHPDELKPSGYTEVCIDGVHAGLGGVDSWSSFAEALPEWRIKSTPQEYVFIISPITKATK